MTGEEVQAAIVQRLRADAILVAPLGSKSGEARWRAAETMREAAHAIERGDWLTKGMDDG